MDLSGRIYWFGFLLIITVFLLTRLPFFLYLPVPGLDSDTAEYFNVLSIIEQNFDKVVGHPQIGYPVFLKICEQISDTLFCVMAIQSLFTLVACLYFSWVYFKTFKKGVLLVSILLAGYASSEMTIRWDTFIYPDSLLANLFLICATLLMEIIVTKKPRYVYAYMIVMTAAISVRPSGLILIPPIVVALILNYLSIRNFMESSKHIIFGVLCLASLSFVHFTVPSHQTFGVFIRPPKDKNPKVIERKLDDPVLTELAEIVPYSEIVLASKFLSLSNLDSVAAGYLSYVKKPVHLGFGKIDKDSVLYYRTGFSNLVDLDSVSVEIGDTARYSKFRHKFIKNYRDSTLAFWKPKNPIEYCRMNGIRFFTYFLDNPSDQVNNRTFFNYELPNRYISHYVDRSWINNSLRDHRLIALNQVTRRSAKETFTENPATSKEADTTIQNLTSSSYYHWIIAPYYKINKALFRNLFYLFAFPLSSFLSLFLVFRNGWVDRLGWYVLLINSLVIATWVLHILIFPLIYSRYTHQITFVYYLSTIMLIPIALALLSKKTTTNA